MRHHGIIQESCSPWSSPVCLVTKADGTPRFCIDYRKVNALSRLDAYPLPRVDDSLEAVAGSKYLTSWDLTSGYWQVEIAPEDRPKTAFASSSGGLYEFNVLPFGLVNAQSTFQRVMEQILSGFTWAICLIYLDDILIFSPDFPEHLHRLQAVFDRLRSANLKIKPSKCQFVKNETRYLGHIISSEGLHPDPAKISAITKYPRPHTTKETRSFLGMASYYRRFVPHFSEIALPLHELTHKNTPFQWTDRQQSAFESLKNALCTAPKMAFPRFDLPFRITSDASATGMGNVLSQIHDGTERVICFHSKLFTLTERQYSTTERECLGVIHATRVFRPYLYGQSCEIHTDHNPLRWLRSMREPKGKFARWILQLEELSPSIHFVPGTELPHADALSRAAQSGDTQPSEVELPWTVHDHAPLLGKNSIQKWHAEDPDFKYLRNYVTYDQALPPHVYGTWRTLLPHHVVIDELLQGLSQSQHPQVLIPPRHAREVFDLFHGSPSGGHYAYQKTYATLVQKYSWPEMKKDIEEWCRSCLTCQACKHPNRAARAPLENIAVGSPMEIIGVDIMGPLPVSTQGNRYILVFIDLFTKWAEAYPVKQIDAITVTDVLVHEFISRHGVPKIILSDQGTQFESAICSGVCRTLGIQKKRSSAYHPQGNGMVERMNRTLSQLLRTQVAPDRLDWDVKLPLVLMAYRTTLHDSTAASAFELTYGRPPRTVLDAEVGSPAVDADTITSYERNLKRDTRRILDTVRNQLQQARAKQKQQYDKNQNFRGYHPQDLVWMRRHPWKKFQKPWVAPLQVERCIGPTNYLVRDPNHPQTWNVHYNRLKPVFQNCYDDTPTPMSPQTPIPTARPPPPP